MATVGSSILPDGFEVDRHALPWKIVRSRRSTVFPGASIVLRQKKEEKRRKRHGKKDSPDQLEDLGLFPLPLLHPFLHGRDYAVRLILGPVLRAFLGRSWGNETGVR